MEKLLKKVEDLDSDERDKLRKMLAEKQSSSEGDKVDWLYKQAAPDDEEYLLGRRVDHHIDKTRHDDLKDVPGALFSVADDVVSKRAEMDMQAKMREDPLYAIKQKEEDARNKLFQNPIKMKQIKALVAEREAAKQKKEKKKKKKKKRSRSSSSSSDDELIAKYLAIVRNSEGRKREGGERERRPGRTRDEGKFGRNRDHSWSDDKFQRMDGKSGRIDRRNEDRSDKRRDRSDDRHRSRSDERHQRGESVESEDERGSGKHRQHYGLIVKGEKAKHRRRSKSDDGHHRSRSEEKDKKRKHRETDSRERKSDSKRTKDSTRSRSNQSPPKKQERKKPLTAEEMERRRAAMQQNAQDRDEQRKSNIERYRAEDEREREQHEQSKGRGAQFVTPMMMEHADQSSVEDRIKRNIYSIQRTKASLDKNFTRH